MAAELKLNLYGDIAKFESLDDGSVIVEGIASSEVRDADGEVITADAMRKAIPAYMQAPAVREMHQPIAAGKVISCFVDDDGNTHVRAKIVDKGTVQKVKDGILRGFSIFGSALKREGKKITELVLKTIDVVDLPNNPKAWFSIAKFDKPGDKCDDPECKNHTEGHVGKCAVCKSKMEKSKSEKSMKKMLTTALGLAEDATEEAISKALAAALTKPAAPKIKVGDEELEVGEAIQKAMTAVGDLRKIATENANKATDAERGAIISKMASEGRVAMKEDGTAYKPDELQKMDLPLLQFASRNATVIPTVAKSVYTSTGNGPEEGKFTKKNAKGEIVPLVGSERISKAWEGFDLNKMIRAGTTAGLTK